MPRTPVGTRYVFGELCLDLAAGELRRGSVPVHLTPTNFELLRCLVSRHGELLTKEQLLEEVWQGVSVGEGSLSRAIATVRQALGDDSRAPRYIATFPRRGYRFIARVEEVIAGSGGAARGVLIHSSGRYTVRTGENVLGRDLDCEIVIFASTVSRRHARIITSGTETLLEDLGSRNGTFIGDERIEGPRPLANGDQIRLGSEQLAYRTELLSETEPLTDSR
ncbi:MAG: FHA domain-containing protein [Thermoanaerobaculia bacterium]